MVVFLQHIEFINIFLFTFFFSFKDYVKKYPKNKILEAVKFLELRKEVLAEIKEADAKKTHGRKIDSGSDSDDMADPMEQVIYEINSVFKRINFLCLFHFFSAPRKKI